MIKPITFCIATANNEREYTKLLLNSLKDHTKINLHEILVFIDSDNQHTYEMLIDMKQDLPNMKICRNPNDWPIGSQRNVSVMFNEAKNDIVCYLQSDMVVGKDFDKHISKNLSNENVVLSCARIEPPLHPASPEKIVKDFGITPEEFNYDAFNKFVDELQAENRPNLHVHFAPFALYKSTWYDKLGGFDTQFRCSREDSDMIIRMKIWGLEMIQSWNACVYHFTCVSSRGKDWFKQNDDAKYKNELQQNADLQELKRFIRKWGYFGHEPKSVYDITFKMDVDRFADMNVLKWLEPYCKQLYLNDSDVAYQLASQLDFESRYYSNLRLKYSSKRWHGVKHLFNPTDFFKKIKNFEQALIGDVIISFKYSELITNSDVQQFIENIHEIVDNAEEGEFEFGCFSIYIKRKNNLVETYKRVKSIDLLLSSQTFHFE